MKNKTLFTLVMGGMMAALVMVATMLVAIPMPGNGFLNFGDAVIFAASTLFGPIVGGAAGAIGASMADVALGFGTYAPFTFVIKGLEGYVVGKIVYKTFEAEQKIGIRVIIALVIGAVIMGVGYIIATAVLYGWRESIACVPGNAIQGGASVLIGIPLIMALRVVKKITQK